MDINLDMRIQRGISFDLVGSNSVLLDMKMIRSVSVVLEDK